MFQSCIFDLGIGVCLGYSRCHDHHATFFYVPTRRLIPLSFICKVLLLSLVSLYYYHFCSSQYTLCGWSCLWKCFWPTPLWIVETRISWFHKNERQLLLALLFLARSLGLYGKRKSLKMFVAVNSCTTVCAEEAHDFIECYRLNPQSLFHIHLPVTIHDQHLG
jgi:hypothetical protein